MMRRLSVVVALGAGGLLLAACGDGELAARNGLPANTVLVTRGEVAKYGPRTPQRALLVWWRAMQYTNARGYLSSLAPPLREKLRRDRVYRAQLPIIARQVTSAFPHIKSVTMSGDRATAYVEIEFRRLVGADKWASERVPQAFPLVREGRQWRIADDLFVEAGTDTEIRKRLRTSGPARSSQATPAVVVATPAQPRQTPTVQPQASATVPRP